MSFKLSPLTLANKKYLDTITIVATYQRVSVIKFILCEQFSCKSPNKVNKSLNKNGCQLFWKTNNSQRSTKKSQIIMEK